MLWVCLFLVVLFVIVKIWLVIKRNLTENDKNTISVGFFHPYCNAGGGGERVLWTAIQVLQARYNNVHCIVYTGDTDVTGEEILKKAESRFNITFRKAVDFVFLKKRFLVEAKMYPYFTLLLQSIGSALLSLEAIFKFVPDIYVDTMGYAFTYPIFKYLGSCKIGCYVHYPTISTDMLQAVCDQKVVVNNRQFVSKSKLLSKLKYWYYKMFAFLYSIMGRTADVVMVNSSWTKDHINSLWKIPSKTYTVYPPCDIAAFKDFPFPNNKNHRILSVAQFRPEKDHELQIKAFHKFLNLLSEEEQKRVCLILVGSCRDKEDEKRIETLKTLCDNLNVLGRVEFKVNLSFSNLLTEMKNAGISLHTMWNEHFGIGIVECMAAGMIMIANDSGGPKMDIVVEYNDKKTGFLACDIDSYAEALKLVFEMPVDEQLDIRKNARESISRFSVENFKESFSHAISALFS